MMTEESAYNILELDQPATVEEITARYQALKQHYQQIKEGTNELKTMLAIQRKQIELDDAFIYFAANKGPKTL